MRKPAPLTLALLGLNLLLLAVIAQRLWRGTQLESLLATVPKTFPLQQARVMLPDTNVANLGLVQDRALFYASRSYYIPPPPAAVPMAPPRPDYRLAGVFVIPNKPALALLLHNSTGASQKVKPGDMLDGWNVQAVENQRVILQYEQETIEIAKGAGASSGGLQVAPLARGTPTSAGGGTRVLGSSAAVSSAASPAQAQPSGAPRL